MPLCNMWKRVHRVEISRRILFMKSHKYLWYKEIKQYAIVINIVLLLFLSAMKQSNIIYFAKMERKYIFNINVSPYLNFLVWLVLLLWYYVISFWRISDVLLMGCTCIIYLGTYHFYYLGELSICEYFELLQYHLNLLTSPYMPTLTHFA